MFQSQDVARAMYFTSWYRFPYQLKRSLNIITMRAQKPTQLTAGYIVPLSLQTFASVRTYIYIIFAKSILYLLIMIISQVIRRHILDDIIRSILLHHDTQYELMLFYQ